MLSPTEEIKSRIDIVELVREYVPTLKKAGVNWKALCPFHTEKTPSFLVSPEKQIWHCFGCNSGGDVFEFIKQIENIDFPEALRILADRAGVKLVRHDPKLTNLKTQLLDIHQVATKFYQAALNNPQGAKALDYLINQRKLTQGTINEFQLGYATTGSQLASYLKQQGFSDNEVKHSGLVVERNGRVIDRFYERLMFPITDHHGYVVAFTGRAMSGQVVGGKYINSPQTLIYNKSQILYGLGKAKKSIRESKRVVVVEGNMDVIASYQTGLKEVVASSGTALTEDQLTILKRYTDNLIFSFDQDQAGNTALARALALALKKDFNLKVVFINETQAKDPDELIKKDKNLWFQAVSQAQDFMEYLFKTTLSQVKISNLAEKRQAAKKLLYWLEQLPDFVARDHYLKILAQKLDIDERFLRASLSPKKKTADTQSKTDIIQSRDRLKLLQERFLALVYSYPQALELVNREQIVTMLNSTYQELYNQFVIYYNKKSQLSYQELVQEFKNNFPHLEKTFEIISFLSQDEFKTWEDEDIIKEVSQIFKEIKRIFLNQELKKISQEIKKAENQADRPTINSLIKKFSYLTEELNRLK